MPTLLMTRGAGSLLPDSAPGSDTEQSADYPLPAGDNFKGWQLLKGLNEGHQFM